MPEGTPSDAGTVMLAELLTKLGAIIHQSGLNRDLLIEIRDLIAEDVEAKKQLASTIDELSGRIEVFSVASGICVDIANGKKSVSLADFCHAITVAERDIFPEDEDEDDDEGGEPVPTRPGSRGA